MTDILTNLNVLMDKVFVVLEEQIYVMLDSIVFINQDILKFEVISKLTKSGNITLLANSIILLYLCYYLWNRLTSIYHGESVENIFRFITKMAITLLAIQNYEWILSTILDFNVMITNIIGEIGKQVFDKEITFVTLKETVKDITKIINTDTISLEGLVKSAIAFVSTTLFINMSIRYVMILFFILLFPIILALFPSDLTGEFSKTMLKNMFFYFLLQNLIKVLLLIPISVKENNYYLVVLLGSMYILSNITNISKELFIKVMNVKSRRGV